jgi:RNA-directed DNA polymerase
VNLSNKEAQASAESGEGKAQTKENIVQSHMSSTQSEKGMSQGLHGVRQAAKHRKQERFTALLHHLTIGLLRDSFYALKRQASPGVDGVTWQEYDGKRADCGGTRNCSAGGTCGRRLKSYSTCARRRSVKN